MVYRFGQLLRERASRESRARSILWFELLLLAACTPDGDDPDLDGGTDAAVSVDAASGGSRAEHGGTGGMGGVHSPGFDAGFDSGADADVADAATTDAETEGAGGQGTQGGSTDGPGNEETGGHAAVGGSGGTAGSVTPEQAGAGSETAGESGGDAGEGGASAGEGGASGELGESGSGGSSGHSGEAASGSGGTLDDLDAGVEDDEDAGVCPSEYTLGIHVVIDVSWNDSTTLRAGTGRVQLWLKSKFDDSGLEGSVDSMTCGLRFPPLVRSALAGSYKELPEFADSIWDNALMPTYTGAMTKDGAHLLASTGALLGHTLPNPFATLPSRSEIMSVDHDGDGQMGITAIPKIDEGFAAPALDLNRSRVAERTYWAIRHLVTLSAPAARCLSGFSGTANVTHFDTHVLGCKRAPTSTDQTSNMCTVTQADFVDQTRILFESQSATFAAKPLPDTATCADVRAALPARE